MKAVVAAFNQEKALVGAFSVITNLRMELFEALITAARISEETEERDEEDRDCLGDEERCWRLSGGHSHAATATSPRILEASWGRGRAAS